MKFIEFFKKLAKKEVETPKTEKISFNKIEDWLEGKKRQHKNKEKEILSLINNKIREVVKNLNEKVKTLENIDINEKKEEDRIKAIVKENLNNYIKYVKDFTEKIDNLKPENLEKFIPEINKIFINFDKKSYLSYHKATFLVGKEMESTKEDISEFFKYSKALFDENKDFFDKSKLISFIGLNLSRINETAENTNKINEIISSLDAKIIDNKELINKILKDIEKIKKSSDYAENLKKQQEIRLIEKELEKEIYALKEMINLKVLANFFHDSEKEMNIIKTHKENFQIAFQKDNGESILNLLDKARLNNKLISDKIKYINNKKEIIKNAEFKDEIGELLSEINKIKLDIDRLDNEKIKEMKKYEKLKLNKEEVINSLKSELEKLNVVVE